ncbi:MAG: pyrroline-5-carboxylate reductase [Lachnospiraceae bacterium]
MQKTIAFIGAGNMGLPLLKGAVKAFGAEQIVFRCAHDEKNLKISKETGASYAPSIGALTTQARIIVLAVKPQYFEEVLPEIKAQAGEGQLLVSLAPGISISYLTEYFEGKIKVVRAMPNTPALVLEGMTALCYSDETVYTEEERTLLERLFTEVGKVSVLPEHLMDAAMVASGCSPAFVYLFLEALADGAVKYGIPRAQAYEMAAQTMIGAGKMLLETGEHPGKLKDAVCSPGGTTIAGVAALEEYGLRNAVLKACDACYEKAVQMKR